MITGVQALRQSLTTRRVAINLQIMLVYYSATSGHYECCVQCTNLRQKQVQHTIEPARRTSLDISELPKLVFDMGIFSYFTYITHIYPKLKATDLLSLHSAPKK